MYFNIIWFHRRCRAWCVNGKSSKFIVCDFERAMNVFRIMYVSIGYNIIRSEIPFCIFLDICISYDAYFKRFVIFNWWCNKLVCVYIQRGPKILYTRSTHIVYSTKYWKVCCCITFTTPQCSKFSSLLVVIFNFQSFCRLDSWINNNNNLETWTDDINFILCIIRVYTVISHSCAFRSSEFENDAGKNEISRFIWKKKCR